jgi:hypothetical protein
MDVWLSWNQRKSTCAYCHQPINKGDVCVVGKMWKRHGEVTYTHHFKWHRINPDGLHCWEEQGMSYLNTHPLQYTGKTRGRPEIKLTTDQKVKRSLLLRRYANIKARIKSNWRKFPDDILRIVALGEQIEKVKLEIKDCGGAPKSWEPKEN